MYAIDPKHFAERRARLMERMDPDSVLVLVAPPERQRSKDTHYRYRASSDILYLCGFVEPETVLVLAPGHDDGEFVLFVRDRDPEKETWEGRRAGPEGAKERFGADAAFPIGEVDERLKDWLAGRDTLYYTLGQAPDFDRKIADWLNGLRHRRGAPPAAPRALVDARDLVHEMRLFKDPVEIDLMRKAATITAEAHEIAMRVCKPGMREYELEAAIEYHFRRNGAEFPAYGTIVGSGDNATILHYTENRDVLEDGEVVLIDSGCEYDFYAADITRSFPVGGRFTGAQRDAYQAVLEVEMAAIEAIRPGLPYDELMDDATRRLTQALVDLKVLEGEVDALVEDGAYKAFYPHKLGHWLGIDVHDVGNYYGDDGRWRSLEAGMVLTIEPGLYFPPTDERVPEGLRGVGIRIEDDILVTAEGHENLTQACPKQVEELEAIIGSDATD